MSHQQQTEVAGISYSLKGLLIYFLQLGAWGFGGPIAVIGYIQRDLVERLQWVSKRDYLHGLVLAQLAPGPLATQLAMYLGWVRGGASTAALTGIVYIIPSFIMVLGLSMLYVHGANLGWVQGILYGVGAAVLAIITRGVLKLTQIVTKRDYLLWGIFGLNIVAMLLGRIEILWMIIGSGLGVVLWRNLATIMNKALSPSIIPPASLIVASASVSPALGESLLLKMCVYFTWTGMFVFGSGFAIIPYLHAGVVEQFHWITHRQFLDAVSIAMITPGPTTIAVTFIGYLIAGLKGAVVATIAVFLPSFILVIGIAPYFRRFSENNGVKSFLKGATAAATGAIAGATMLLAHNTITDVPSVLIAAGALLLMFLPLRVPEPFIIAIAGCLGLILKGF